MQRLTRFNELVEETSCFLNAVLEAELHSAHGRRLLWSGIAASPFERQESSRARKGCHSETAGILTFEIIPRLKVRVAVSA